ncbi:hypothetical protein Fot_21686 [Forsythia ovata]|uniref:Uncharacterized protein n=1 Tax=Forsythia ovata TaxID=205694 RepID=A0ABD1UX44_9LAMI
MSDKVEEESSDEDAAQSDSHVHRRVNNKLMNVPTEHQNIGHTSSDKPTPTTHPQLFEQKKFSISVISLSKGESLSAPNVDTPSPAVTVVSTPKLAHVRLG